MSLRLFILALLLMACTSCSPRNTPTSPLERYGWRESFRYRATTEEAVSIANRVLRENSDLRFRVSWKGGSDEGVPIYLVDGDRLSSQHIVFIPNGERWVVINTDGVATLLQYFASESEWAYAIPAPKILAFSLLHEAGHIHFGDSGSFVQSTEISKNDIVAISLSRDNVLSRDIVSRNPELRADLFAIDAIEQTVKRWPEDIGESIKAARNGDDDMIGLEMGVLLPHLEFNLALKRDPNREGALFGGSNGNGRRVFLDSSYSHPNLEFRFLVASTIATTAPGEVPMNYSLDSFLRERSGNPDEKPYWEGIPPLRR
jgi:hypothetical protein